jgi:hypothetical protein
MTDDPQIPTSPSGTPLTGAFSATGGAPADAAQSEPPSAAPAAASAAPRLPSRRATAGLAAAMLAIGVAAGAAIGPAPDTSLAGASRLAPLLLPSLSALALARDGQAGRPSTAAAQPPAITPQATPGASATTRRHAQTSVTTQTGQALGRNVGTSPTAAPAPTTPKRSLTPTNGGVHTRRLPAITNVWLVEVAGATFADVLAQPAATPYISGQLLPAGTLLSGWSALAGSAFASDAALLASTPPQTADAIVAPPCPEGVAGAQCAAGTAGALSAADSFLQQTIPAITATAAYREHGLIVVVFAAIGSAPAAGLPAGASTATLTSQPPTGVLLLSPFAHAGARSPVSFDPTSPKQSLERLLR